ncbi:MAG: alanine--tRNA ligase, partial [Erysipelotrichaceae bacterium]|nr:alanine--tRNA ligase [Erysipelotrichaceae bacterium]
KEAIPFAWHFLTDPEWMGFDKNRLYITVYTDDQEAYDIWTKDCGVDPSHILRSEDNFWEIGNGPCGPDTEIYYDRGEEYDPQHLGEKLFFEEMENGRYIETWNVVFSQYNSEEGVDRKDYKELPQKNIDTGMGLERLVCIVQGGETNFDTDLFLPVIREVEKMTDKKYEGENKMAFRVIADHIRTVTFALADGAVFSNEGRGYILRRVLRRAVRYGKSLNIKGAYMYKLVQTVADNMRDFYPYLQDKVPYIQKLVKAEEERFQTTLNEGEKILNDVINNSTEKVLAGDVVFKLYDTYGFPLELTKEIAEEKGFSIDQEGFDKAMAEQRRRAREARSDDQSMSAQAEDLMNFTEPSEFLGYSETENDGTVIGLFKDGVQVDTLTDEGDVIFDRTCFYAESGGQIYDCGTGENDETSFRVTKVIKAPRKQPLHHVVIEKGELQMGDKLHLAINTDDRRKIRANHSSLHLLQSALREIIGDHVHQAGSFVCPDYGRFDFTHYEKVTNEQLKAIEAKVNEYICAGYPVVTEVMDIESAKKTGAMALFDEKYDDMVRVVTMGDASKEFCGGTHVANTAQIGVFKIISEESIGSGIRRITSKTSFAAYEEFEKQQQMLEEIARMLKVTSIGGVVNKVAQLAGENTELSRTIGQLKTQLTNAQSADMAKNAEKIGDLNVLITKADVETGELKGLAETLNSKLENGVVLVYGVSDGKVVFASACSKAAIAKGITASNIVKTAAQACGGNGGGRPDLASAGGKDATRISEALRLVKELL